MYGARTLGFIPFRKLMDAGQGSKLLQLRTIREAWCQTVRDYIESQLTYQSDKLVAVAGIAKTFQNVLDDVYIAGLWKRTLVIDLLWWRGWDSGHRTGLPRAVERAPSWTWACLDCVITMRYWDSELPSLVATVESVEIRSEITRQSGTLRLEAPLLKAICDLSEIHAIFDLSKLEAGRHSWAERSQRIELQDEPPRVSLAVEVRTDDSPGDFEDLCGIPAQGNAFRDHARSSSADGAMPKLVWIYLLFILDDEDTAGIVLKRSPKPGHYTRIGFFDANVDLRAQSLPPVESYPRQDFELLPADCEEDHGEGIYTVAID
jgi:hypothetical protein